MTLDDFRKSVTNTQPPAALSLALAGLWWDAKGDWKRAHESAQQDEGRDGSMGTRLPASERRRSRKCCLLVRSGRQAVCREPLDAEWLCMVKALLR
jgi:hypothetical protein